MASAFSKEYNRISLTPLIGRKRTHPANFVESFQYYTHIHILIFMLALCFSFLLSGLSSPFLSDFAFHFLRKIFFLKRICLMKISLLITKHFYIKMWAHSYTCWHLVFTIWEREKERENKLPMYIHSVLPYNFLGTGALPHSTSKICTM